MKLFCTGMVFMSSSVLPWAPILDAWLKTRSQQEADCLRTIFAKCFGDLHTFVQAKLKAKMFVREALYVRQCYDVLQGILDISEEPSTSLHFHSHTVNTKMAFFYRTMDGKTTRTPLHLFGYVVVRRHFRVGRSCQT